MLSGELNFFEGNVVPREHYHRFSKTRFGVCKGRTVWNETMQAFEQINAMKAELESEPPTCYTNRLRK